MSILWQDDQEKQIAANRRKPPAYGALAAVYAGKDPSQLLDKIIEYGKSGLIDEYYDIKASDPSFTFKAAKWVMSFCGYKWYYLLGHAKGVHIFIRKKCFCSCS